MVKKDPKKVARGKKSKAAGGNFELRTRKDLEMRGWIVSKWPNNLDIIDTEKDGKVDEADGYESWKDGLVGKIVPAKNKFRGIGIPMAMGTGFPDFIAFRQITTAPQGKSIIINKRCDFCDKEAQVVEFKMSAISEVIGVESKTNGKLDKVEIEKCRWYIDNQIFHRILISEKTKVKNKIVIIYHDFVEKYGLA